MMNAVDALREAGYVFRPNVMQPEFDYPLDFWERESDGLRILGRLDYFGDKEDCRIILYPYGEWAEWDLIHTIPDNFIAEFTAEFERLAPMCKDD